MMTEEERVGLKQSEAFFNFGSDGEELGGDLEDALEPPPRTNGSASVLTHKLEGLTMTPSSALPPHHLLPPSAFASAGPALQDPAIMSMVPGVTTVPPAMVGNLVSGVKPPPFPPQPNFPPTQPGMKSMADLEAEMLYGARPPAGPPPPAVQPHGHGGNAPVTVQQQGNAGGPLGHLNPAMHNLSYPGMRDRSAVP